MDEAIDDRHQLRFCSLLQEGACFVFPCDARGCVDLDGLTERTRNQYLYARAMVGREVAAPRVVAGTLNCA